MLCVTGVWPSDPKKLIRPVVGSSDGFVTVTSPPTVASDAGTPGQYHVLVILSVCVTYGRVAVGVGANVAAKLSAVCRDTTRLAIKPPTTATTIKILRTVTTNRPLRRRPAPVRRATATPRDRLDRSSAPALPRPLRRDGGSG